MTNPLGANPFTQLDYNAKPPTPAPLPGLGGLGDNPFVRGARDVALGTANTVQTLLMPAQAGQQLLYGAVGALSGVPNAWERAARAAGAYASYGLFNREALGRSLSGQELFKQWGAPDWLQRWGGLTADIFADPTTLLGGAGLATKTLGVVSKSAEMARIGEKAIDVAKGIDRATTLGAPALAATAFRHSPQAVRGAAAAFVERGLEKEFDVGGVPIIGPMFREMEGRTKTTLREMFVPQEIGRRILTQATSDRLGQLAEVKKVSDTVAREYEKRRDQVLASLMNLREKMDDDTFATFDGLISDMAGAQRRSDFERARGQLYQEALKRGQPELYKQALRTYRQGVLFDYWSGQQLVNLGLLTDDALKKNLAWSNADLTAGQRFAHTAAGAGPAYGPGYVPPKNTPMLTDWVGNDEAGRRGSIKRMFLLYGDDAEAHIANIRAQNRPASVALDTAKLEQALASKLQGWSYSPLPGVANAEQKFVQAADPAAIARTLEQHFVTNPSRLLVDGVAAVAQLHNLNAYQVKRLLGAIDETQVGFKFRRSSAETAKVLENLREEAGGGAFVGSGTGALKPRQQLSEEVLSDLGMIRSAFVQYEQQANAVGRLAARKSGYDGLRQVIEGEMGSILHRDDPNLPLDMVERYKSGSRWRAVTADQARASMGVFKEGEIVPSWAHRTLTVAKTSDNRASYATLTRMVQWWKAIKLANPASIARNVLSGVIQADEYGVTPLEMAQGFSRYLAVHLGRDQNGLTMLRDAGLSSHTLTAEARSIGQGLLKNQLGLDNNPKGVIDAIGRYIDVATGINVHALEPGLARNTALFNPLTGFGFGRKAFDAFGKSEEVMKSSIFFAQLAKGHTADEAADLAEQALFDYTARPLWADFTSRSGLDPFSTYRTLATWRTLENLYDRPVRTARLQRIPQAVNEWHPDDEQLTLERASMQDWLSKQLPLRIGTDSQGRGVYIPFLAFLPGNAVVSVLDDANGVGIPGLGGLVSKPPLYQLFETAVLGIGYQGRETYQGLGGGSLTDAMAIDSEEALRRVAKEVLRFISYPWAPAQPVTERVARSLSTLARTSHELAQDSVDATPEQIDQGWLRFLRDGPLAAYGWGRDSVANTSSTGERAMDLGYTLGRFAGLNSYAVQGDVGEPGAARNAGRSIVYERSDLLKQWQARIKAELDPARREELVQQARADLDRWEEDVRRRREPFTRRR